MKQYDRYNVVGTSGAGKSTFSRALADILEVECIELDRLWWRENWTHVSWEDLAPELQQRLQQQKWVLDGNYKRLNPIKWEREVCVVWLDYSFFQVLRQAIGRALHRAWTKQELWPDTNNRESFTKLFFSRDSIVLWTITTFHSNRRKYLESMRDPRYAHVHFVRLRNRRDAEEFLNNRRSATLRD